MDSPGRRALILGGLGTVAVFAVLFVLVDGRQVVESVRSAEPWLVGVAFAFALCWLAAWSLMLKTVLSALDVRVPVVTTFFVYAGAVFANNVTPFGQAGGEPVAALLISRVSGSRYETGLAGIASVDVLNVVPSLSLVVVGVGYYATTQSVGSQLEAAVSSAAVFVGAVVLVVLIGWRYQQSLVDRLPGLLAPGISRLGFGRLDPVALEQAITTRLEGFFDDVGYVATDRWRLSTAVGLSLSGWLFQAAALLTAFAALGHSVHPAVVLFAIPLANLAGAAPLPGGLGGVEAAFVGLLVPTTSVDPAGVTAAVLIFRGAIYWMPVVIGGASVAAFSSRAVR